MASKNIGLSLRDRFALVGRAIAGSFPTDVNSIGGKLLTGVIQPGGTPPTRGVADYLKAYSEMPWLRAVASRVSYDVAAVTWKLCVEKKNGKATQNRIYQRASSIARHRMLKKAEEAGEVEEITSHPALDLLNSANSIQTGLQMRRVTQLHMDLVGDCFWLLERGAFNEPTAIWPIPPHWVLATPTPRRPSYRVGFRAWRGEIPESEVIWFSDVDPINPYGRGTGTAQALADELETDEYVARHTKAFFFNRARPDLIVSPKDADTSMEESDVERLEESWVSRNQGFWRAFKPFFLRRAVEIKELDQNFRSQQLVQLREFERNTILQIFGVSPETLGIISTGSNRATITMGDAIYSRRVLVPRLELLRTVMQERFLPIFDERLILDYESPVTRDHELELEAGKIAPYAASVDEWREKIGLPPLEGDAGKVHMVAVGQTPVEFDGANTMLSNEPDEDDDEDPEADDEVDDVEDEDEEAPAAPVRAIKLRGRTSKVAVATRYQQAVRDARVCESAGDADAALTFKRLFDDDSDDPPATRLAERQVVRYRRAQERSWDEIAIRASETAIVAGLQLNDDEAVLDAFGGIKAFSNALTEHVATLGRPAFLRGAELALEALPPVPTRGPISISLTDVNPEAVRWAEAEAARLIKDVGPSVRRAIRTLIAEAHKHGLTPKEVSKRLRSMVGLLPSQVEAVARYEARLLADGVSPDVAAKRAARYTEAQRRLRATRIARTELMSATNNGQQALWQHARQRGVLPATAKRVWIATHDDRLDTKICLPLDGETAGLDEPFKGGHMVPPAHPGCRCAIGLQVVPK